jgi:hypothetical protein
MAAARKVGSEGAFSTSFHSSSTEENNAMGTEIEIAPPPTPSHNHHLTPALVPNSSAAWATAAYLYMSLIYFDGVWVPGGHGNPRLLRWLLDWIQVRFQDGYEVTTRSYTGELWLWRVVIGAYALTAVGASSVVENVDGNIGQKAGSDTAQVVDWYKQQLYKRRQATWVPEWEAAKEVLEKIQWLQTPGSPGELVLEKAWQYSVRESGSS